MQNTYFAAANSGTGFVSYYGEIFVPERFERLYLIKGGPGTGKSNLIRRIAEEAGRRGLAVRRYLCSSDPDSLDGVTVGDRFAVFDATAPHTQEPRLPGAVDELIDLGQFWDAGQLAAARGEIAMLNERKKAAYSRAYGWLSGAAACERNTLAVLKDCLDYPKMRRAAARYLADMTPGQGSDRAALIDSVGMHGPIRLDSMHNDSATAFLLTDTRGGGALFLQEIDAICRARRLDTETAWAAVNPEARTGIALPTDGVAFVDEGFAAPRRACDRVINLSRFWLPDALRAARRELRHLAHCHTSMLEGASMAFDAAKEAHFSLEQIYIAAMDFDALSRYRSELIARIFAD